MIMTMTTNPVETVSVRLGLAEAPPLAPAQATTTTASLYEEAPAVTVVLSEPASDVIKSAYA